MQVTVAQLIEDIGKMKARTEAARAAVVRSAYGELGTDPNRLIDELLGLLLKESTMKVTLNRVNNSTMIPWGNGSISLFTARSLRDHKVKVSASLDSIANTPTSKEITQRYKDKEGRQASEYVQIASKLEYAPIFSISAQSAKEARELNALIQQANWTTIVEVE